MAACIVRQRYHAVVVKLAARAKWASEPVGRPRKDVITRAREVIMAIFIDSFHRRMLSLHKLIYSLDQLDRMVAWADDAADNVNAKEAGALGLGLPMSEIGLSKFMLLLPLLPWPLSCLRMLSWMLPLLPSAQRLLHRNVASKVGVHPSPLFSSYCVSDGHSPAPWS
ncbi:unnamed protein product [Scytosiphon promiscuus]